MVSRSQKGMALVLAIMLLLVLFVMGSTLLMMTTTDVKIAGHQMRDNRALFVADAAIQEVLARITSDTLYIGDTVGYVRRDWQSELYAGTPPAGSGDTLRFRALLGDTGLKYGVSSSPVVVHYLKDRNGRVMYYDPDSKKRMNELGKTQGAFPIYVAEATGFEGGGEYPVRRRAISEFVISALEYGTFDYALHTGGGIYFQAVSSSRNGRLSTFSAYSDRISIKRAAAGYTIFIDADGDGVYDTDTEANFFGETWTEPSGPYDIMQMDTNWAGYPPPKGPPPYPDLSDLADSGFIFVNGDLTLDTVDTFIPKFGETWLTGDTINYSPTDTVYIHGVHAYHTPAEPVPHVNMSLDYWEYQGAEIVDKLHPGDIPKGWELNTPLGYSWKGTRASNPAEKMASGTYFFSDYSVIIDTVFNADGDVKIITPHSVYIKDDVYYEQSSPKMISFIAGQDIVVSPAANPNVIVKAFMYAKKRFRISKQAVILGAVIIGGGAEISGESAIILDRRLNSAFQWVDPDKRYVSTVLSWREVRP